MLHALSTQDLYTGNKLVYCRPSHSLLAEVSYDEAKMYRLERPQLAGKPSQQPELKEEMSFVR